jgi:RNA polymerase sigma-70 factor (ECF subfamily)
VGFFAATNNAPSYALACAEPAVDAKLRVMRPTGSRETIGREALQHVDALYAYAHYLARDAQRAEDLVQETFARCMAGAQSFTPGTALKAWLFRILRNVFLDLKRREAKSPIRAELDVDIALDTSSEEPDYDHLRGIVAAEIEQAMRALPEPQRSVVLLDLEGFSESEMADVLGCAPGTIKSRLARARAALRVQLKEYAR